MNYGNKDGFNFSELFYDRKYRSRLILAIYGILFIILIVVVRTTGNDNVSNNVNNNIENETIENNEENVVDNEVEEDTDIEKEESEIEKQFSYILMNNYDFEFTLYYNDTVYVSNGKRYERKYDFVFGNEESTLKYLVSGNIVKAKIVSDEETEYSNIILPYFYINYFDGNKVKTIIENATMIEDNVYEISNEDLYKFVEKEYQKEMEFSEGTNKIYLTLKNNIVTEVEFDITNLVKNVEKENVKSTKITLKYNNFGLIDDFEVNFE